MSFEGMLKAPMYGWEVFMRRNHTSNAYENSRARNAYVTAPNEADAKKAAKKMHPEFHPVSARKITIGALR